MDDNKPATLRRASLRNLPRNVWAVSLTGFFMDNSSEALWQGLGV